MFLSNKKVVIGDLGLGRQLEQHSLAHTQVGTPLYSAPEVCQGKPYTYSADVWAFGCAPVLILALTISPPLILQDVCAAGTASAAPDRVPLPERQPMRVYAAHTAVSALLQTQAMPGTISMHVSACNAVLIGSVTKAQEVILQVCPVRDGCQSSSIHCSQPGKACRQNLWQSAAPAPTNLPAATAASHPQHVAEGTLSAAVHAAMPTLCHLTAAESWAALTCGSRATS